MQTTAPGVFMWSAWQPDRNMNFNSFVLPGFAGGGNVVVDPLAISDADAAELEALGGVAWIVVTNRDHERATRPLAQRFGARIATSALEAPLLSGSVDRTLDDGEWFFGARVVALCGAKTPGEFALVVPSLRSAIVGDALWGDPAGDLRLMPSEKLADPGALALSLRAVAATAPEHLLLGDGAPLFGGAHATVWRALERCSHAYVNRINRDDVPWKAWTGGPEIFGGRSLEVGDFIGAKRLGYRITEVPPGKASCPLHWHTAEEELFVVLRGGVTLETERGDVELREGDYVCFPARREGAHRLVNRGAEACEVLMIANVSGDDVCAYPASRKILVESMDLIVRDNPALEYFDGE